MSSVVRVIHLYYIPVLQILSSLGITGIIELEELRN
jgi:hypothetical protein